MHFAKNIFPNRKSSSKPLTVCECYGMIPTEINAFIAKERMNFMPVNDSQMSHTVAVFSKNLTRLVKNKMNGLPFSQSQFAKENNLGTTALNQWRNGRRFPSDENLDRLCEIFQVPLAELFIEPWQSINIDNKSGKIDKTETAVSGNDLNVSHLHENINAVLGIVLKLSRNYKKSQSKKDRLSEKMEGRFYYAFISSWKAVYFDFYSGREEILG